MSGSDGPRAGLDRGIAALRWLLVSAQDDPSARREVLPALSRCTVLVPTITGAQEKLRYLPQPAGGSAMVVFTGHDALEHAAKKLGWAQGASGVSFRAMSARDALEAASLHGVRAVIVDAGAEHALEINHEDVSLYLSRGTAEFAPESLAPSSRGTGDFGQPRKTPAPSRGTGEFSSRGTGERNVADLREEVAPRKARDARRDESERPVKRRPSTPTGERQAQASKSPSREASGGAGARAAAQPTVPMPTTAAPQEAQPASRKVRNLAEIDDPFISSTPRQAPSAPLNAGGQARRVPSLAAPPLSREMPSAPFESSRPASGPVETEEAQAIPPAAATGFRHARDETIPLDDITDAEAARASALRQASLPVQMFGHADSVPAEASKPEVRVALSEPFPVAPSAPPMPFSDAPAAFEPSRPVAVAAAPAPAPVHAVAAAQAIKKVEAVASVAEPEARGTGTVPKPPADAPSEAKAHAPIAQAAEAASGGLAELSDAVLSAIADELRKFPEVEWACVLPDRDKHVIAVRVDPSYLERTSDIEASLIGAAKKAGAVAVPVIVSMPGATKDARTRGRMFFPWKKKK